MDLIFFGGLQKICMFHEPEGFGPNIFGHSKVTVLQNVPFYPQITVKVCKQLTFLRLLLAKIHSWDTNPIKRGVIERGSHGVKL
jgi:hypothetical protein